MIDAGRFAIFGSWDDTLTPDGKLRIVMPPLGIVFGAGWHPITQAGLSAVAEHVTPGCSFADIGAGSGILTVAAKLCGASRLVSCEINPNALAVLPKVLTANGTDSEIVNGSFPLYPVDVATVSISSKWVEENLEMLKILVKTLVVIEDDETVTVIRS